MYLIYFQQKANYTEWFNPENHFVDGMVVFNLIAHQYTIDGVTWIEIKEDHL